MRISWPETTGKWGWISGKTSWGDVGKYPGTSKPVSMDPLSLRGSKIESDEFVITVWIFPWMHPQLNHPVPSEHRIKPDKWTSFTLTKKPLKGIQNLPNWSCFAPKQTCGVWSVSFIHLSIIWKKNIIWETNFTCLRQSRAQSSVKPLVGDFQGGREGTYSL